MKSNRRKNKSNSFLVVVIIFGCILSAAILLAVQFYPSFSQLRAKASSTTFVTRAGSTLYSEGKPFRFSGANIYWLGLDENVNGVNYPTKFRTDDALATAKEMGANVVRSHTLGASVGCAQCLKPTLTTTNEAAFDSIDYAIYSAKNKDLRVIIPLTDNWNYYHGGKKTFTDWRGLTNEEAFYTDQQVREDYKEYISYVLNHVNKYTGVALKDEPAILAWETGNELDSASTEWTAAIADYIKSIDSKHLIADGRSIKGNTQNVDLASVDLYNDHQYPLSNSQVKADAAAVIAKKKVFYVGELDWTDKSAKQPQATITSDTSTKNQGTRSAKITVTQPGRDWDIQFMQGSRAVSAGTAKVEFWAKSSNTRNVRVVLQKNYSPWNAYGEKVFTLTTAWQKYSFDASIPAADNNTLLAFNVGESAGTVWLDNASLTSTNTGNALLNNSFETTNSSGFANWNLTLNASAADTLSAFLPVAENAPNGITGTLYWSLFGHNDTYGFVQHNDSYTIHYPGDATDMTNKAQQLRIHAYVMRGIAAPSHRCPNAAVLNPLSGVTNKVAVTWRGSVGAKSYNVQRLTSNTGSWQTVGTGISENTLPWIDTTGKLTYKYRVQPVNYANVAGPYSDGTVTSSCKSSTTTP